MQQQALISVERGIYFIKRHSKINYILPSSPIWTSIEISLSFYNHEAIIANVNDVFIEKGGILYEEGCIFM